MKKVIYLLCLLGGLTSIVISAGFAILWLPLPDIDGEIEIKSMANPVMIEFDGHGIPSFHAENRLDAIRALGYLAAQDRLFQMDLIRRKNAGRLAEVFGQVASESDIRARTLGFNRVAEAVVKRLSAEHRQYLEAYADGVNTFLEQTKFLPFEFTVLNYRPKRWTLQDSMLAVLGMFDMLTSSSEQEERMLTVMEASLPKSMVEFLTPNSDRYTDKLLGESEYGLSLRPIPVAALSTALKSSYSSSRSIKMAEAVQLQERILGSNAWAVSAKKTEDGRAILANDMHLGISVPTIWYRAEVNYGPTHAAGVVLPGLPIIVAGSNGRIAWGVTNLSGDYLDLVSLEINPGNVDEYKVNGHWRRFGHVMEKIEVKDGKAIELDVKTTLWGPVLAEHLLNNPVAIHWAALDEKAVNLGLIDMEQAVSIEQALDIVNQTGGPQLNFLTADNKGRIAWSIMGKIPNRNGIDGSVSRSWSDGTTGWDGYIDPKQLARVINPAEGYLVSANNRRFGKTFPYPIGRQFANGYRAYRISEQLEGMQKIDEKAMFDLQLDTQTDFFKFYQELALSVLSKEALKKEPGLAELRDYLSAWNGKADEDSLGLPVLQAFRKQLAKTVFKPFLSACLKADKNFSYSWTYIDTPLQALLTKKIPELLPDPVNYRTWDQFILDQLKRSAVDVKTIYQETDFSRLPWGNVNKAQFVHPFSRIMPMLGVVLDMPADKLPGCSECVRVATSQFGASERLVVSPEHMIEGILHMPGGQSGQPLSPYYRDQEKFWVKGLALPLLSAYPEHRLKLKPTLK